jgi:hypothetical protein
MTQWIVNASPLIVLGKADLNEVIVGQSVTVYTKKEVLSYANFITIA